RHSRVAMSAAQGLATLGVGELRLISPPALAPDPESVPGAVIVDSLDEGLAGADVVMALRIQRERIGNLDGVPGIDEYFANYGISQKRLEIASPDVIIMHPGPMNRGIEIESAVADGPRSVITQQVTNGLAVRMAMLERVSRTMAAR
ncbi:MAG: aspartate carbamoyltransferase catalytic subunit, partial [Gammaproteobacteria bacterium]|nr:aspartate carbamoyltransferase catalytic subunit [Gammaproteobacteria bacterium]